MEDILLRFKESRGRIHDYIGIASISVYTRLMLVFKAQGLNLFPSFGIRYKILQDGNRIGMANGSLKKGLWHWSLTLDARNWTLTSEARLPDGAIATLNLVQDGKSYFRAALFSENIAQSEWRVTGEQAFDVRHKGSANSVFLHPDFILTMGSDPVGKITRSAFCRSFRASASIPLSQQALAFSTVLTIIYWHIMRFAGNFE